ncbi:MAG: Fis family transcriptional regulator [Alphaproteobacteria bacterium]|nr:Fis family transcriptional regulator [Alphaproteobacteria bacterium]
MTKKGLGSSFDDFLAEEGLLEDVSAVAQKRVLARQVAMAMRKRDLSKVEMARRMGTSRAALDRLLDPDNPGVTLATMERAAIALGKSLRIRLVDGAS